MVSCFKREGDIIKKGQYVCRDELSQKDNDTKEMMRMKKDAILILISVAAVLASVLPKSVGTVLLLIILVPVVIHLIVDIIKNGNREKK